jgi:hypothetical protein
MRDTSGNVALSAQGLCKDYKRGRAVDGVDLTVGVGERVACSVPMVPERRQLC